MRHVFLCLSLLLLGVAVLLPTRSYAELWCAEPVVVHEWGVQVFGTTGAHRDGAPPLPRHYHNQPARQQATTTPVRHLPVDGGERELPIVHFYSTGTFTPVPVGFEVGFTRGEAERWYPQVDRRTPAVDANGAAALASRNRLIISRTVRLSAPGARTPLPSDPTRQLEWANLSLTATPQHTRHASELPWVDRLRNLDGALWVNAATESERFLFYDARTTERPAVTVVRGPTYSAQRHHYLLRNTGTHAVHDVFLVNRTGATVSVFYAPSIPAGAHAGFLLEEHRVATDALVAATRGRLRAALVDPNAVPPTRGNWGDHCVMQRDPAIPVEHAEGHKLYAPEVDAILEVWASRFFDQPGATLLYREDPAYLDTVMPLSIYTDMFHFVQLRRAGLAVQSGVALP